MYPTYTLQGLTGIIGAAGARQLLNGLNEQINVQTFGATGRGDADDTNAFRRAIEEVTQVGRRIALVIPQGVYKVQDPSFGETPSGTGSESAPLLFPYGLNDVDVIGYGATLKIGDNGVGWSTLRIFGNRVRVFGLTIDCGAATATLQAKGCTAFEVNGNYGGGIDCAFVDCIAKGGYDSSFSDSDPNQGMEHFLGATNVTRLQMINCLSVDSGWNGFRTTGYDELLFNCIAHGHRGNGFRINEGTVCNLIGCQTRSSRNDGRSGFLIDPGSTPAYPVNRRTRVFMSHCRGYSNVAGVTGCTVLKIAGTDVVRVRDGEFEATQGTTSSPNIAVRFEDNLRKVILEDVQINGSAMYTPSQFHGAISSHADAGAPDAGKVRLTLGSGHGLVEGDTIFVQDCDIVSYNRPHNVITTDSTTVVTDVTYVAGTLGANAYAHEGVDEVHMKRVDVVNDADSTYTTVVYLLENAHSRILDLEDVTFDFTAARTQKMAGIDWEMPDAGLDRLRLKNVKFLGNTTNIFQGIRTATKPTSEVQTVTVTGTPTGGSFTLTITNYGTSGAINWNASITTAASNMQTALRAMTGLGSVTVAGSGADWSNAVFTITFLGTPGGVAQATSSSSLTGGTPNIAHATTTPGVNSAQLVTSGKTIGVNVTIANRDSGTVNLVDPYGSSDVGSPYSDRATLFNSYADAFGRYLAAAVPAAYSGVGWNQGDHITNSAPGAAARPGWHAIATTASGTAPSFQQEAALS